MYNAIMFKLENLDVVGGVFRHWLLPIIIPAILFTAGVASWAYLLSKDRVALKKYWFVPVAFLVVALVSAVVFHPWGKVSY